MMCLGTCLMRTLLPKITSSDVSDTKSNFFFLHIYGFVFYVSNNNDDIDNGDATTLVVKATKIGWWNNGGDNGEC